jgi:hypothetical protein
MTIRSLTSRRGILIACADGLAGFSDAVTAAFPATVVPAVRGVSRRPPGYADLVAVPASGGLVAD